MTRRPPYPRTVPRPWQESPAQQQRIFILDEYGDLKNIRSSYLNPNRHPQQQYIERNEKGKGRGTQIFTRPGAIPGENEVIHHEEKFTFHEENYRYGTGN